jgi:hypothetical protein
LVPTRSFARPLSLTRGPIPSALSPSPQPPRLRPRLVLCVGKPPPTPPRLASRTSLGRQGEDPKPPAHPSPHLPSPRPLPSPRSQPRHHHCPAIPPSSLGLCHRLRHGELRLSVVHREPASSSPFTSPSTPSSSNSLPMGTGDRRRRVSLLSSRPEPPDTVPSFLEHCP